MVVKRWIEHVGILTGHSNIKNLDMDVTRGKELVIIKNTKAKVWTAMGQLHEKPKGNNSIVVEKAQTYLVLCEHQMGFLWSELKGWSVKQKTATINESFSQRTTNSRANVVDLWRTYYAWRGFRTIIMSICASHREEWWIGPVRIYGVQLPGKRTKSLSTMELRNGRKK